MPSPLPVDNSSPSHVRFGPPLRICIDARLTSGGELGGVEQFVIGLASGLSQLSDGDEEYWFLTHHKNDEWLQPYLRGACRILHGTAATRQPRWTQAINHVPLLRSAARKVLASVRYRRLGTAALPLPHSDGLIEQSGFDVMHFPTQSAFLTSLPSIYQPWDLQHLHLPQYFTPETRRRRETEYRAFCAQARMVAVATTWQKEDLIKQYQLAEEKVRVVEPAAVIDAYPTPSPADLEALRLKLRLPPRFVFYPAQTWPHKNHLKLLEALALLREREGLVVPLVASGKLNDFFPEIERKVRELGLQDKVMFPGFVSPLELQCLYRLCRGMIFPTLFEGFGLPLVEAFLAGVPSACSNVTSLPAQAGDAALIFDPYQIKEIAAALRRIWTDDALCDRLATRGRQRVAGFTWDRTARLFRAHYRRLTGRLLSPTDEALLSTSPLI